VSALQHHDRDMYLYRYATTLLGMLSIFWGSTITPGDQAGQVLTLVVVHQPDA
jgi:hypothetical protein